MNYDELSDNFLETFRDASEQIAYLIRFADLLQKPRPEVISTEDILRQNPEFELEYYESILSDIPADKELENFYQPLVKLWNRCRDAVDADINFKMTTRIILESCLSRVKYAIDHVGSVILRQYETETGESLEGWNCEDTHMEKDGREVQNYHGNVLATAITLNVIHARFWEGEIARSIDKVEEPALV